MAGEDDGARRSKRLMGEAPEVFATPLLRLRWDVTKTAEEVNTVSQQTVTDEIFTIATSLSSRKSSKRSVISKASTQNEAMQRKIIAEIESMQRIGKAEEEVLLARLERERKIEEKRLQMASLQIDAQFDEDSDDDVEVPEEVTDKTEPAFQERVSSWIEYIEEQERQNSQDQASAVQIPLETAARGGQMESTDVRPIGRAVVEPRGDPLMDMNRRLEKLLSRQAVPRELPFFHGEPDEWPMFYHQYQRTTELCGLSNDENMVRLMKCLKGKAREAVLPILGLPDNVGMVTDTLESMFGRADQIVKSMVANVKALPACTRSNPDNIILFSNLVSNLVATMRNLKRPGQLYNPLLLEELVEKLPVEQQFRWCDTAKRLHEEPTLGDFQLWLTDEAMTARMMPTCFSSSNEKTPEGKKKENKKVVLTATQKEDKKCFHCSKEGHKLEECKGFINSDVAARWKTVKNSRVCYSCLIPGHRSSDCRKKIACGAEGCDKPHNKLLHKSTSKLESSAEEKVGEWVGHAKCPENNRQVLLRIIPVNLYGTNGNIATYALLDEGSTVTMIDAEVADRLGLSGDVDPLCVQWTNEVSRKEPDSRRVGLEISGAQENVKRFRLQNARTVFEYFLPKQTVDMKILKASWPYLQDVPFPSLVNAQPVILIGSDNLLLMTSRKLRQGHWNDPVATKTWLGWVLHGNLPKAGRVDSSYSFHVCENLTGEDELNQLIKASFSTESFGVRVLETSRQSTEDERALKILTETTRRVDDRFETGLLWKADNLKLPESRSNAIRRLHCMEKKMERDPAFRDAYHLKIQDYITKGYCRKLSPEEAKRRGPRTYYLPHFGVFNPNKPGKLRLVFDAAARSHGVSLNDCLLKGPDLLNPLPGVLMRFRRHRIGIVGDIREMFHQIRILAEDVDSQRFLWREDGVEEPEEYVMEVMIFGATCSPASALYVKDRNATELAQRFPDISKSVIENTYMDDNLHGANGEQEAIDRIRATIEVFGYGGFPIVNWASSSRNVVNSLSPELRAKSLVAITDDAALPVERVLGLNWNAEDDRFTFLTNFPKLNQDILNCSRPPTRREIASLVMSVYDPLGLVVHFTIKGRILLQEAWLLKSGWDDAVSEEMFQKWKWWVQELQNIVRVRVPRCYSQHLGEADDIQLHIFVDASSQAFASIAYLRIEHQGEVDVAMVLARARVAPLKPLTIPKLELQAAVLGSRMALTIKEEVQVSINANYFWSDAQTVIAWIRSDSPSPKQFVASRIGEILEATEVHEWRWVPTEENVADEATRSNPDIDFEPSCRWYTGPRFLRLPESEWPKERIIVKAVQMEPEPEILLMLTETVNSEDIPDASHFSSWLKLVRSTAWFKRGWLGFLGLIRSSVTTDSSRELTAVELEEAQVKWWKATQEICFKEDLKLLRKGKPISNSSRLKSLSPFLDSNGVLRMKGRTELANDMAPMTKAPVILDPRHRYSQLLISHLHEKAAHQGVETVLNELRVNHWVLNARAAVKKAFHNCQMCKIMKVRPVPPEMGLLPMERLVRAEAPFRFTGVDYFGPILVSQGRKLVKRYGVLFTCFSIRAIHLEIAPDLSTAAAINAIRRFVARRGVPEVMWSDNGTNFRVAARELQLALSEIDVDEIQRNFAGKGMTWKFNPPSSPHMGGVWERMVKSVKTALTFTLKEHTPKEDVLATLFMEAEFIINNRPLTYVSVDPADPECLTPNHFLIGRKLGPNTPGKFGHGRFNLRCQWRLVQELTETLWTRWVKEYLPTLTRRTKWFQHSAPITVGDVVVVVDKDGPRNSWPLGRITNVYPGKDGKVRVVDVKTKDGTYRRPVTKICVLDVTVNSDEPSPSYGGRHVTSATKHSRVEEGPEESIE